MIKARWNTGRKYQKDGQWIAAQVITGDPALRNGRVVFVDASRMVYGQFEPRMPISGSYDLQLVVMQHYDSNDYENCQAPEGMVRYALGEAS